MKDRKERGSSNQDALSAVVDFFVENPEGKYDDLAKTIKSKGKGIDYYDMDYALTELAGSFVGFLFDGKYASSDVGSIDPEQLSKGILVEREHTSKDFIAKKIALDHLVEFSDYYSRLAKMESEAKKS